MREIPLHWGVGNSELDGLAHGSSCRTQEEPLLFAPSLRLLADGLPNASSPYFSQE